MNRLNGNVLYLVSRIVRKTCRFQISGENHLEMAQSSDTPLVLTTWHGMTMMLIGFLSMYPELNSLVVPMPDDWRGETLSVFTTKLGAKPYPMNLNEDSTMATARKLARLITAVKKGHPCYITPDGPAGPAYVIKPGVAYIAKKAGARIIPLGAYARHGYRLNRWDRYVIPYPFSRISIHIGEPRPVSKEDADLTAVTGSLTNTLHRVAAQAAANYYEQRP